MAKASSKKAPKAAPKAAKKPLNTRKSVPAAKSVAAKSVKAQKPVKIKPAARALPVKQSKVVSRQTTLDKTSRKIVKLEPERSAMRDVPVAPPVPTDGKPRKNLAGLNARELEHFRELLLLKRRELVGDMSAMEREALRTAGGSNLSNLPLHMADMGTDNYEQEFTLGLVEKDRQLLREINNALAKIQSGTYGICEGTGKPISRPRLEAQPWAKFSIEWARQLEQRQMIRR